MALVGITETLLTLIFSAFLATAGGYHTLIVFAIIVLGGLGDPIGAMVGGVFFAIVEQVSKYYMFYEC